MTLEDPAAPTVFIGAFVLWGLFNDILGFFVGKTLGYREARAEHHRNYVADAQAELRRRGAGHRPRGRQLGLVPGWRPRWMRGRQ
jgi:hypothetical protein